MNIHANLMHLDANRASTTVSSEIEIPRLRDS